MNKLVRPFQSQVDEAERLLKRNCPEIKQLNDGVRGERNWLFKVNTRIELKFVLPFVFPIDGIRVIWTNVDNNMWPHCEGNGELCISEFPLQYDDIELGLKRLLSQLQNLFHKYDSQSNFHELISEPVPYWLRYLNNSKKTNSSTRQIRVQLWSTRNDKGCKLIHGAGDPKGNWFLAETHEQAISLASRSPHGLRDRSQCYGIRIPIKQAWYPSDFPINWLNVSDLLTKTGRFDEVSRLMDGALKNDCWTAMLFLFFDAPEITYGVAIPTENKNHNSNGPNFTKRPLKKPVREYLRDSHHKEFHLCRINLLDDDSVFRRVGIKSTNRSDAKILVVGCGSLGSMVADELLSSAVKNLLLVDADTMNEGNLCRHVLSMAHLDKNKASALAQLLTQNYPVPCVNYFGDSIENVISENKIVPSDFDLILALTGDQPPIWLLEQWRSGGSGEGRATAMLVAWLEPHGVAGHAVLLDKDTDLSTIEHNGNRRHNVVRWQNDRNPLQRLPGCSATYQVMGRSKLLSTCQITCELALDFLDDRHTKSRALSYIENEASVKTAGGYVKNPALLKGYGNFRSIILERPIDA